MLLWESCCVYCGDAGLDELDNYLARKVPRHSLGNKALPASPTLLPCDRTGWSVTDSVFPLGANYSG